MRLIEELDYDLDFNEPRVIIKGDLCIIENVKSIVMIGENSMTVETPKKYVTIKSDSYVIKEIMDGRILVEGEVQGIEIIRTHNKDKHRRIQNR